MSSPSPGTSQDISFTPRKEFMKELSAQTKSFSLLALSSSNCIRLYSFSPLAVASLRRLLEQSVHVIASREDTAHNLYEFALDGKPWANPKSVPTEKLLVDIIAVIYQSGYAYLSTIDYGREADDRLAMTFSTLSNTPPTSRTVTPLPPSTNSPNHDSVAGSSLPLGDKSQAKRVPFAISFSSVTVMRVISPPLHLTPAILQAVRGSWPRGVVAEKKVGENSYEFKLKGYKWFQEDTFATDSLVHILSLLTSLDSHSFTLLTSISLTNRSRVKDLWIFTGPAPEGGSFYETSKQSLDGNPVRSPMMPLGPFKEGHLGPDNVNQHRRVATDPTSAAPHTLPPQNQRAATEIPQRPRYGSQPQVLRKPAPRAQVPISVGQDLDIPDEPIESTSLRAHMPSTISSGIEDMTGVGAGPNIYSTPSTPDGAFHQTHNVVKPSVEFPNVSPPPISASDSVKISPPLKPSSMSPLPYKPSPTSEKNYFDISPPVMSDSPPALPPLLGVGTFRDSAFSTNSEVSCEIPIQWTGPLKEEMKNEQRIKPSRAPSSGPAFPGGWQPTPIMEKSEDESQMGAMPSEQNKTPVHEMGSRIDAPEIVRPDMPLRKSEAALVGIIHSTSPPPPIPQLPVDRSHQPPSAGGGQGWVLVDVDNPNTASPVGQSVEPKAQSTELAPIKHTNSQPPIEQPSPTAKAIVIMDAMDTKHKKSQSTLIPKPREGSSGVRRFFSLSKKNSKKALNNDEGSEVDKVAPTSIPRSNLRDRLRLIGTPEASRREDKRRSID